MNYSYKFFYYEYYLFFDYQGTDYDISKRASNRIFCDLSKYPNTPRYDKRAMTIMRTYLTPLWPAMEKLPEFYQVGSRYQTFRRDSGWWVNSYVQKMARFRYRE